MRFEFSAGDVARLLDLVYYRLSNIAGYDVAAFAAVNVIYRKLKAYALDAYENRELYRKEMSLLKEEIDRKFNKYAKNTN